MPRYIVRLGDDQYVDWSTIVDAPVNYIVSRDEAIYKYGEDRIARADENNHSALYFGFESVEKLVSGNRAGENETELSLAEILSEYRDETEGEK